MDIRLFKHQALCAAAAGALGALGGCQSYNAAPLDARAHAAEFALRSEHSPQVADFARALAADGPAPGTDSAGARAIPFDPADGVNCEEAEVIALVFNADLRRARAQLGVASAVAAHAGLWEDPMLGVDLTRVLDRVANPNWVMATISLTIPISGRLEIEKARAGAERAAEVARVLAAEWRTRAAVRSAWAEWRAAARRHEVLQELSSQLESLVGVVDRIERAGEIAALESGLFRIEQAQRRIELRQAEGELRERELMLRQLMGLAPAAPVRLVASDPAAREITGSEEDQAVRNPALAIARAEYEVAERRLELEIRKQYPDIEIGPGYGRESGENQFLLGISLPIPVLNRNQQGIAEAGAMRDAARVGFEAERELLAAESASARVRLAIAQQRERELRETLVPLVDRQFASAREVATKGEVNTLMLLETLTRREDAKLALIDAMLARQLAGVRVEELAGPPAQAERPQNQTTTQSEAQQ